MALVITQPVLETFDPNITDGGGGFALMQAVANSDPEAARLLGPQPYTFSAEGTSLGNEAVTLALLAPINLTLLGVPFPVGSLRNIRVRCWSRRIASANSGYSEVLYTVVGAATPTIPPDTTVAASLAAVHEPRVIVRTPNNNSASAPEYAQGVVIMDAVSTTNVIVGVQNRLGTTNAATATPGLRWRLEVLVDRLQIIPLSAT